MEQKNSTEQLKAILLTVSEALMAGGGLRITDPYGKVAMVIPGVLEDIEALKADVAEQTGCEMVESDPVEVAKILTDAVASKRAPVVPVASAGRRTELHGYL